MPDPVVIVPYDSTWPQQFEQERLVLARVFAGASAVIEHVGSTAVPGLGAKPILDIMIGAPRLQEFESRIARLAALGYEYVQEFEVEMPERRYLRRRTMGRRSHQLHGVVQGGSFWVRHLAFRDYLRTHPEVANEYFLLKQELANQHRMDPVAYAEAKSDFIQSIEAKAGGHHLTGSK